jgi:two-component system sensor histidine kinase KdpD
MEARTLRLLEDARAEIGVAPGEPERLDLAEVLAATVTSAAGLSHHHRIELEAHADAFVKVEPGALQHVIGHLLENAVKYSPEGGIIHVRVRRTGRLVEVAIADDGVGIPNDVDLFAPFQRGEHDGISGTGLGLYIVAKLVHGMGGRIEARRNRKAGSTFVLELPAA